MPSLLASSWQPIDRDIKQFILCNIDNANDMCNNIVCKQVLSLSAENNGLVI